MPRIHKIEVSLPHLHFRFLCAVPVSYAFLYHGMLYLISVFEGKKRVGTIQFDWSRNARTEHDTWGDFVPHMIRSVYSENMFIIRVDLDVSLKHFTFIIEREHQIFRIRMIGD